MQDDDATKRMDSAPDEGFDAVHQVDVPDVFGEFAVLGTGVRIVLDGRTVTCIRR